jgi:pyruvate, water dikinase
MCKSCPVVDWALGLTSFGVPATRRVTDEMADYVLWYDQYDKSHAPVVGGKNASLGEMTLAGLPVPPGFAVTIDAYQELWAHPGLGEAVNQLLASIDHDAHGANQKIASEIRNRIEAVPMPTRVADAIAKAYRTLCDHCGVPDVPVAVRSSATAEDLPDASFAGQQDTFLWIRGADDVVTHVQKCWSSLFTDRAIAYRHMKGYLHQSISMSVGVQKMVDPVVAGVAFTLNPTNGDRSQVAIDASWGLGEAVVSGEVTPDNFLVDKVLREVVKRTVSHKTIEYRLTESGLVECCDVEPERQSVPCISDEELVAVAILARRAEKHYGRPQDVEWAIDRHLPKDQNVVMLQSRPETVWSQKPKAPIAAGAANGVASVVSTLMAPMYTRGADQGSSSGGGPSNPVGAM